MGSNEDHEEMGRKLSNLFVSDCLHEKRRMRELHRQKGHRRCAENADFAEWDVDECIFLSASFLLLKEYDDLTELYLMEPYYGKSSADEYIDAYMENAKRIKKDLLEDRPEPRLTEALIMMASMAARSMKV